MEKNREDQWVADRLAALEPQWQPDLAHGRRLLDAALDQHRRSSPVSWRWAGAAAAAVCLAALAIPQTRAIAQQLWRRITLNRVEVVRLDLSDLPLRAHVTVSAPQLSARDLDDAERQAGFRPNLPPPEVAGAPPALSTVALVAVQSIHVLDIEAALRKLGVNDVQVPPEWEGVQLRADIGPLVTADYPGGVQILQAKPIEVSIPAGFPLEHFAEIAFRSIGVTVWEARALARKFVANPSWFLDIPPDEVVNVQEVPLCTGSGLLIEDFDDDGKLQRATVICNTPDRVYAVSAPNRELAIRMAGSLE